MVGWVSVPAAASLSINVPVREGLCEGKSTTMEFQVSVVERNWYKFRKRPGQRPVPHALWMTSLFPHAVASPLGTLRLSLGKET